MIRSRLVVVGNSDLALRVRFLIYRRLCLVDILRKIYKDRRDINVCCYIDREDGVVLSKDSLA